MDNHWIIPTKSSTEQLQSSLERINQIDTENKKLIIELKEFQRAAMKKEQEE